MTSPNIGPTGAFTQSSSAAAAGQEAPRFVWLPLPLLAAAAVILELFNLKQVYGPQWAPLALNSVVFLFTSMVSTALAAMAYMRGAPRTALSLGSAMLFMGLAGLLAGLLLAGGNTNGGVAVFNLLALLAGGIFLLGVIDAALARAQGQAPRRNSVAALAATYGGCLVVAALLTSVAALGRMPLFVTEHGSTPLRLVVLTATVAEFSFAALIFALLARYVRSVFLVYYWVGLGLIAVGLAAVAMTGVNTLLNWTGRLSQALGQAYIVVGIISLSRRSGKASPAIALSETFSEMAQAVDVHRRLLEAVFNNIPAEINLMRASDLRVELANPAYLAIAPGKQVVGRTLNEIWPETGIDFERLCREVLETGLPYEAVDREVTISRGPGEPTETRYFTWSLIPVHLPDGSSGILNMSVETTARRLAEQELRKLDEHKLEFYRRTIFAATEGKLLVCSREEIEEAAGAPVASVEIAEPADAPRAAAEARRFAVKAGIDEDRVYDFLGCVTEATANAIKHAGGGVMTLHSPEGRVMCVISDSGPGIGALELPDVALTRFYSTAGTLGMGYKLMIKFADRVYLSTGPNGTVIALEMSLKVPEPALAPDIAAL